MKTSLLISSIAALGLLITFAGAPRRHAEDNRKSAPNDNISIVTVNKPTMLAVVVITPVRNYESGLTNPSPPTEYFSDLKFDVNEYMEADDNNLTETEVLPEATQIDFGYLKFKSSDFSTDLDLTYNTITELPVNGSKTIATSTTGAVNEFEYLRFDVDEYINNTGNDEIGELP